MLLVIERKKITDMTELTHAFMTSRLEEYCNALLGDCLADLINKLKLIQNAISIEPG